MPQQRETPPYYVSKPPEQTRELTPQGQLAAFFSAGPGVRSGGQMGPPEDSDDSRRRRQRQLGQQHLDGVRGMEIRKLDGQKNAAKAELEDLIKERKSQGMTDGEIKQQLAPQFAELERLLSTEVKPGRQVGDGTPLTPVAFRPGEDTYTKTADEWDESVNKTPGGQRRGSGGGGGGGNKTAVASGTVENPTQDIGDDPELNQLDKFIKEFKGSKKIDLSPILSLVDTWTGSSFARSYDRPMTEEEREQVLVGLEERKFAREADLKYKKAYLVQMAADRNQRAADKTATLASQERIAGMRATASSGAAAGRSERALRKDNEGLLRQIAKKRFGGKGEFDKSYKDYVQLIHTEALEIGETAEETGATPPGTGYQFAVQYLLAKPNGPDGGGQEQE